MKFNISNKKVVRNEIIEKGSTMVIQLGRDIVDNTLVYNGSVLYGIFETIYETQMHNDLEYTLSYWIAEPEYQSGVACLPSVIGYENDNNNTLIIVEKYNEI
jgi:hypothetical protein